MPSSKLTHSRIGTYKTCPKKHYFAYELGLRPARQAKPLRFGNAIHEALDRRAKGDDVETAIGAGLEVYGETPEWVQTDEQQYDWAVECATAEALLRGYFWYWGEDAANIKILHSEASFNVPIMHPELGVEHPKFTFAGKRDKVIELTVGGKVAVQEHKTCSEDIEGPSEYWRRLQIDHQISGYYVSAHDEGINAETVLYDVIRKPTIRPATGIPLLDDDGKKIVLDAEGDRVRIEKKKKDGSPAKGDGAPRQAGDPSKGWVLQTREETPAEYGKRLLADIGERPTYYYGRREIDRLEADLNEFRHELYQVADQIMDAQHKGHWFRNTGSCRTFNRLCEYFDLCTAAHDPGGEIPAGFERVDDVHPELA